MNKTKIDWADMTWNPVTGCLHGCKYCYARKIAQRFGGSIDTCPSHRVHIIDEPFYADSLSCNNINQFRPYPYGFDPTFHKYRLGEPLKIKKPQNIFVCSMADLFGDWVPDKWIKQVFEACEKAPQHRYLFLTKNPKRYEKYYKQKAFPYRENFWFGTTATRPTEEYTWFKNTPYKNFLSIEPILEPFGSPEDGEIYADWVIIGAETGNRKGKVIPKREWIENIVEDCRNIKVPVFMKESLKELMGDDFVQEFPWEAQNNG